MALASIKVNVAGLNIKIRLFESIALLENSKCGDNKVFCRIADLIVRVNVQCVLRVDLLNEAFGFEHKGDGKGRGKDD